jgi:tetratricopeptide (TPR) repeat protein
MNKRTSIKIAGMLFILAILGTNLNAQERNDVIKVYNEGAKAVQTDLPAAIKAFENAITLADQVGETAQDLKDKAIKVLPGLYFKVAYNVMNEKKPAGEIIQAAKIAAAAADKYNSATYKENAEKVLVQGYNIMGSAYFTANEYDKAIMAFDSLLAINPDYLTAIYNKALVYLKQQNSDAFETTIDMYIEKLKTGDNEDGIQQASKMALEYFRAAGSQALQGENLDEALSMLNKATKYGEDKDLYYYLSDLYNKKKDFDKGQEYAQKGLALETGDAEAKAKFYYQIATAQVGKGETSEACGSFKNAQYGAFAEASKAQRTNLKCKDAQ